MNKADQFSCDKSAERRTDVQQVAQIHTERRLRDGDGSDTTEIV